MFNLKEERAKNRRGHDQENTGAEPACCGFAGVGIAAAEFVVHFNPSDQSDDRANRIDELRCGFKIRRDHLGGLVDAGAAVALGQDTSYKEQT